MLYNEEKNIDYINMSLKRFATEDEINVINSLWKEVLPYRYIKGYYNKLSKKFFFTNRDFKKIKIKGHHFFIKSSSIIYEEDNIKELNGDALKAVTILGATPNIIELSTANKSNIIQDFYEYGKATNANISGVEILDNDNFQTNIFTQCFLKKKEIRKSKIKNGLNIIVLGDFTDIEHQKNFNNELQKKLTDATFEITKNKLAIASQTCEKGIFNALAELLQKKKWGIYASLDNLHKTNNDSPAWKYLTAQNPERIIFAVKNRKLVRFLNIIDKYEIPFSIIGKVDKSKHITVMYKGKRVINLPKKILFKPILKINKFEYSKPKTEIFEPANDNFETNFYKIINDDFFKTKLVTNFNNENNSMPYIFNETTEQILPKIKHYISSTIHSNSLQISLCPYQAGKNLVCDATRKIVALGHKPLGISIICNINFSQKGEVQKFDEIKKGFVHSAKRLKLKILNVNIYNTTAESNFCVNVIGKRKNKKERCLPYFEKPEKIYIIGRPDNLTASSYYQKITDNKVFPYVDEANMRFEKRLQKCIKQLQKKNLISACVSVDKFGITGALFKALTPKNMGFKWTNEHLDLHYLFNENQSRVLVSTDKEIEPLLEKNKVPYYILGETNTSDLIEIGEIKINI